METSTHSLLPLTEEKKIAVSYDLVTEVLVNGRGRFLDPTVYYVHSFRSLEPRRDQSTKMDTAERRSEQPI